MGQEDIENLKDIWAKRLQGADLTGVDWSRPVSDEDVAFLLSRYPFLQIVNNASDFSEEFKLSIVSANSGWVMHDYGDAISVSSGLFLYEWGGNLYAGETPEGSIGEIIEKEIEASDSGEGGDSDSGEGGDDVKPPPGTIIKQTFETAAEMVAIAKEKGWTSIYAVAGTRDMCWAAWMVAEELGLAFSGYDPTEEEEARHARVKKRMESFGRSVTPELPGRKFGSAR